MEHTILMVAGEASGDLHGGALAREIRRLRPEASLFGVGGDEMEEAGVETLAHVSDLGVTGLTEVLARLGSIRAVFHGILSEVRRRRPALAVLIDYPDFNLRLAKRLRRLGVPVVYYVSPQIWAWRRGRVKQVARDVTRMLVILPFETAFYQEHGVDVRFVGHPLMDLPLPEPLLPPEGRVPRVVLLPGSRPNELQRLLPVMAAAAEILSHRTPRPRFELLLAPTLEERAAREYLGSMADGIELVRGPIRRVLPGASAAMVASGTATLETALCGVPMVVGYRLTSISYLVARLVVRVEHVALVNIVAGRRLVPELIQSGMNPQAAADEVSRYLDEPARVAEVREGLMEVRKRLGQAGAAGRAARATVELLPEGPAS